MITRTLNESERQHLEVTCKTTADRRLRDRCQAILMADRQRPHVPHSISLRGGGCQHASPASRGEDLESEAAVACGPFASFDFHAVLASVLRPTLIRDEVVEGRKAREKRLLAAPGMLESLHGAQRPRESGMGLSQ
jgi:hypothetical protein